MKNHFYISYFGNKRNEAESFYNLIDFKGIDTIVEPFCGTSAISYYISTKKQGLKYILNDNDEYLKMMFDILRDDEKINEFENMINSIKPTIMNKEAYQKYLKDNKDNKNIYAWFIKHFYYTIRPGIYPLRDEKTVFNKKIDLKSCPIYEFYNNNDVEFYDEDAIDIYEKYNNKKNCLIFLDPPYIDTCNDSYEKANLNIYEYLYYNKFNKCKAKIYLILEDNWIIKLIFNNFIIEENNKTYQTNKKKTKHLTIYNKYKQ